MNLERLKKSIRGEVLTDEETLKKYSHDASLFEVRPSVVVFPKNVEDIKNLVNFTKEEEGVNLTARSGGTDMTGGPLGESIILAFEKYFNQVSEVEGNHIVSEPGVYYRDFEKETLKKGLILPSFPASREICAIGGMVANNSGGEKTLKYGKTENYVVELKAVLSDGEEYIFRPLNQTELEEKMRQEDFEGGIYRKMFQLVRDNEDILLNAKPRVSKNSAGYALWDVWNPSASSGQVPSGNFFDLTKLFVGSQGTLGIITEATFRLVPVKKYSQLLVVMLKDLDHLAQIIETVLLHSPESFESYDNNTFKLALKYFYSFAKLMGTSNILKLGFKFLPEMLMVLGGMPKLVLLIELADNDQKALDYTMSKLKKDLGVMHLKMRVARDEDDVNKYHLIRRESFNLLRQRVKDKKTAPFIDDVIVSPSKLSEFLPKLNDILDDYKIIYTLAGHVGDGNFHIIPLMNLKDKDDRKIIPELMERVYDLVFKFNGSMTGEHNDGLIRTPYLEKMFGKEICKLFLETKRIFDPQNIFNRGKKVNGDLDYALRHIRRE